MITYIQEHRGYDRLSFGFHDDLEIKLSPQIENYFLKMLFKHPIIKTDYCYCEDCNDSDTVYTIDISKTDAIKLYKEHEKLNKH